MNEIHHPHRARTEGTALKNMRFVSFEYQGQNTYGVWNDETSWIQAPAAFADQYADLKAVIAAGQLDALEAAARAHGRVVHASECHLLPVIPNPSKVFCVGLNYKNHVAEMKRSDTEHPAIFTRFADSLSAHGAPLPKPAATACFDYEGELAIIIGKGGRHIGQADAWDHIAGYTCFNDATARDWQRHTSQWIPGKNFPATGPLGPFMATRKAVADITQVTLVTRLNGEVMQHASVADLIFTVPVILEYVSSVTNLSPGDVIATGTPGGVGDKRQPPVYMKAGDVIEVEITGLGTLRNVVADSEK